MNIQTRQFAIFAAATLSFIYIFLFVMPEHADIIVVNAHIHTMDGRLTQADAMAIRGDRIVGVGSRSILEQRFRAATVLDLDRRTVLPGFIDAHAHLLSLGLARMTVDLVGAPSEAGAAVRVRERVSRLRPGQWVRGRGWDQNEWRPTQYPTHSSLDRVAPRHPVYLARVDGHAAWVNRRAMEIAGISRATPDPPGGKILRSVDGEPTGVFIDAALDLLLRVLPEPSDAEMREALDLATSECVSVGITGMHDMGADRRTLDLYQQLVHENRMPIRIYALVEGPGETWDALLGRGPLIGYGDHRLTVRGIKLYADGALGSRGAAMIDPYSDDPTNRGLTMMSEESMRSVVSQAVQAGFQVSVHAIGDRGNNIVLNVYESVLRGLPPADRRLRIEHAQVLHPDDIGRFRTLNVIPSMQPTHCTSDMYWAEARLGARRVRGAYAWRSLLATGVKIPGGSDFPVEKPGPLAGIAAAVTRRDGGGRPASQGDIDRFFQLVPVSSPDSARYDRGWYGDQCMTVEEAVRCFTEWAAYAAFEESEKGTLEQGKLADFVVLSGDPFSVPARSLWDLRVERTVIGGKTVFGR